MDSAVVFDGGGSGSTGGGTGGGSRGALSLRGLRKRFGATEILRGIDIEVASGEFLILVGPSGCGKSTLLNIIAGLDAASSGQVLIGGRDVTQALPRDRDIAMVFQSYALYPNMSVAQNIAFGLEMRRVPKAEREATVARVAATLQIEHLLQRKPAALSGGQRQRVAMGRALARNPQLFLFDEPLSNLDAKLRVEMRAEIKRLHQRTRTTTVYVTHDQVEAMTLGDRIAVMKEGRVQQLGTPADIYGRPATRFVADFIGSPAMNLVRAQRTAAGLAVQGRAVALTEQQRAALAAAPALTELDLGVRPEDMTLLTGDEAVTGAGDLRENSSGGLPGTLEMVEPTGPETYATVATAWGPMTARLAGTPALRPGEPVRLRWAATAQHLFDAAAGGEGRRLG